MLQCHGFTAGGTSDVVARALGAKLTQAMGQQAVVDPRSGAGTTMTSEHVAKSASDGYTLFLQDMTTHAINASLYRRLPYDSVRDFTPITLIAASPLILVVEHFDFVEVSNFRNSSYCSCFRRFRSGLDRALVSLSTRSRWPWRGRRGTALSPRTRRLPPRRVLEYSEWLA